MLVLGMMSGTSADGIDAALVRISGAPPSIRAKLEGHHHIAFPWRVRQAILRLANGGATTTAEISQLNFLLGEEFAAAAGKTVADRLARPDDFPSRRGFAVSRFAPCRFNAASR